MQISRCPACNAPVPPGKERCAYCGQYLIHDDPAQRGRVADAGLVDGPTTLDTPEGTIVFRRVREPTEGAFSLLIPQGWQVRGGIQRAHQAALNAQSIEAKLDFRWLAQEAVNQEFLSRSFLNAQQAAQAREQRILQVQRQMQDVDRQITENRMRTNAEIHNDNYLTLMNQKEYINPFTNEPETGSNQWQYRWVTAGGEEFYTDNADHDPNVWGLLNASDWRRTAVRPRFGG